MVLFICMDGEEWIAKPDRPFGQLQLDLYRRAFNRNEKVFDVSLTMKSYAQRTYVSQKSWRGIVERVNAMELATLEDIAHTRAACVSETLQMASAFKPTLEGLTAMFEKYETMISYFHFRCLPFTG